MANAQALMTAAGFDSRTAEFEALARDWAERECSSFDAAVNAAAGNPNSEPSIWDMPAIDSKRTVSLLTELEALLGMKLPVDLIKSGGYADIDELLAGLIPRLRAHCTGSNNSNSVVDSNATTSGNNAEAV